MFHRKTLFIGDYERHVEEGSGNGPLSIGTPLGNLEGVFAYRWLGEREYMTALLMEILSLWKSGRRAPLLGTLKAT
jgi:hypothetical protein